jgi:hypothetical protein
MRQINGEPLPKSEWNHEKPDPSVERCRARYGYRRQGRFPTGHSPKVLFDDVAADFTPTDAARDGKGHHSKYPGLTRPGGGVLIRRAAAWPDFRMCPMSQSRGTASSTVCDGENGLAPDSKGNDMTNPNNELAIDELNDVSGGALSDLGQQLQLALQEANNIYSRAGKAQ